MKLKFQYLAGLCSVAIGASLFVASCSEPSFKIKGEIYGADNQPVLLEKSDFHGRWMVIDSTRTASNGSFSISRPAPAAPEIFRLDLDGKFIYLPIDSIETITVTSSLDKFGSEYTLTGTDKAQLMEQFDKEVMAIPANISPDSLESFKRHVFTNYIKDAQGSVVSYYVLTKTLGNKALFDPDKDLKYFGAVATGFKLVRPNDPRTALLEQTSLAAHKRRNSELGNHIRIEAEEIAIIDIDLQDENGTERKLSDLVGKGKPVVVMFTLLTHPDTPALNVELSKLYNSLRGNVEFYEVSLDPDQYAWRDAARNLPWITVFDPNGQYSTVAGKYNVTEIPSFYIYNRAGELSSKATTVDDLRKNLANQ